MSHEPGEIQRAIKSGYRVTQHRSFFPFTSTAGTIVHAIVDHGARAVFCSEEWWKTYSETKGST